MTPTHYPQEGPDAAQPLLDLRIQLDASRRVVSVTLNDAPIELNRSGSLAARDCHDPSDGPLKPVQTTVIHDGGVAENCASRGQKFLLKLFRNGILTLLTAIGMQWSTYRLYLGSDEAFLDRYGWWILYLDVSVVALVANLGYLRSYIYVNANHMVGMMIGMTIGMQVGTMIGGVLGATNGFFIGSTVGMTLGSLYGVASAWCCGPMAVMHGLMAGVMGGTMGAMVVIMMIPDHVLVFMPIFTTVNLLILAWFTYLFYKECVVGKLCPIKKPMHLPTMLGICLLTIGFLTALMVAGPKGPMVWKGQKRMTEGGQPGANPFSLQEGVKPGESETNTIDEMRCGGMMMSPEGNPGTKN